MSEKDLNHIAKVEKAIKEKYGEEAIHNPKGSWDKDKEEKYLQDLKIFYKNCQRQKETEELGEVLIKNRRTAHTVDRECPLCGAYSFSGQDDVYMTKFGCCFKCYVQYVEGREDRWKNGWRPNK